MAHLGPEAVLTGFIAGVAVASVISWIFRDRIRAAMIRRRAREP
jgi:hypothetical protein